MSPPLLFTLSRSERALKPLCRGMLLKQILPHFLRHVGYYLLSSGAGWSQGSKCLEDGRRQNFATWTDADSIVRCGSGVAGGFALLLMQEVCIGCGPRTIRMTASLECLHTQNLPKIPRTTPFQKITCTWAWTAACAHRVLTGNGPRMATFRCLVDQQSGWRSAYHVRGTSLPTCLVWADFGEVGATTCYVNTSRHTFVLQAFHSATWGKELRSSC